MSEKLRSATQHHAIRRDENENKSLPEAAEAPHSRAVYVILYSKDGKFLLQHRDINAKTGANQWGLFGGSVEENEDPQIAAQREAMEEIEYTLHQPTMADKFIVEKDKRRLERYAFVEEYDRSQPLVLHEGQGFGWFSLKEILQLDMREHTREILQRVADKIFSKNADMFE
jgi:8-oxo-dGTP diphosphatase